MKSTRILDCTLRDGGYVNDWYFGKDNIKTIIARLVQAGVDIIECGFLTQAKKYGEDHSQFNSFSEISDYLPKERTSSMFVAMINYGEYSVDDIPPCNEATISGIRVTFRKTEIYEALHFCEAIKNKGYAVFLQPMSVLSYGDEEFMSLIHRSNVVNPFAFYIVDSFGAMKSSDLLHFYQMTVAELDGSISIGFHSHNNLQLSYSHAQVLVAHAYHRKLIIDSSVFGMGRGAGNLNTELFADYLNQTIGASYNIEPILQIMDEILNPIYQTKYWGYSLPHYLSALHNLHPNYASYLDDKSTLTAGSINSIFKTMDNEMKLTYNKEYIEALYQNYQDDTVADAKTRSLLCEIVAGKDILLIAPGKSLETEMNIVVESALTENTVVFSVNFIPEQPIVDFVFVSNNRRWESIREKNVNNLILTSNIRDREKAKFVINYASLLNDEDAVRDNAGMLLISLLITLSIKSIRLAGIDGYGSSSSGNFVKRDLEFRKRDDIMAAMNLGLSRMLEKFSRHIPISFVTQPRYVYLSLIEGDNSR